MDLETLAETIYEAAVIAERWPRVLEDLNAVAGAAAGALIAFGQDMSVRYVTTRRYETAFADYAANGTNLPNIRPKRGLEAMPNAFAHDLEVCTEEELAADPVYVRFIRPYGFGWTAGTVVPVPSGDLIVYDMARSQTDGPFTRAQMERLDPLRPHLARAALLAHRLRLEAARSAANALGILGLPAVVVSGNGTVSAANELIERLRPRVDIGAFNRLYLQSKAADAMLTDALGQRVAEGVRSIAVPATVSGPALVVHVVPIRRAAHDVFARAEALVLFTPVTIPSAPLTSVLTGLFDLTPAEARVARGISTGQSIDDMALAAGLSRETVRSHLKSLMLKTGTSRQAELAVLLSGLRPL